MCMEFGIKEFLYLALRVIGTRRRIPERLKVKQENSGCDGSFIIEVILVNKRSSNKTDRGGNSMPIIR